MNGKGNKTNGRVSQRPLHSRNTIVKIVSNGKCAKATTDHSKLVVIAPTASEAETIHRLFQPLSSK